MSAILKDPPLRYRAMEPEDLASVICVEIAGYQQPWSIGIFRDCLRSGYCCKLALLDGQVLGHYVMSVAVGEAHLLNICIHPDHQGRGFGRKLLHHALRVAREKGADTVFLEVRISNNVARGLYESEGFNEFGQRFDYYPAEEGREDALVFAKSLL